MPADLNHTALAVGMWRKNTRGPLTSMPVDLQLDIVRLLKDNSWEDVCRAVGVGRSSLSILRKRHCGLLQLQPRVPSRRRRPTPGPTAPCRPLIEKSHADFIELPVAGAAPLLHVELRLPSGIVMQAHSANAGAVGTFISKILADAAAAA